MSLTAGVLSLLLLIRWLMACRWYYKEGNGTQERGGCKLWEPRPEVRVECVAVLCSFAVQIFSNGFAGVRKLLGTPFITHSKYFSKDNLYQTRYPL